MSFPDMVTTSGSGDGVSAQLLLSISKDVSGLVTDVAVIKEQTRAISDHEERIRQLRAEVPAGLSGRLAALEQQQQLDRGGRDILARVVGVAAALGAIGAAVATYVHH